MQALKQFMEGFTPLTSQTWTSLQGLFTPFHLDKNQYFARPGEPVTRIGFLQKGTVRAYFADSKGVEYNKTFQVPYSFIGAYSALTSGHANYIHLQALEPCELLVADYSRLTALYDTCPDLERFARKLAETYFAKKEKREIELVLLDAAQRYAIFQQEFPGLENRIPQYQIASYLGITPTQLSRIRARKPIL